MDPEVTRVVFYSSRLVQFDSAIHVITRGTHFQHVYTHSWCLPDL